jgi:hypothetical protein
LTDPVAKLRAVAFVAVALAVVVGLISRMTTARSDPAWFEGVERLRLSPGEPLGSATFDGVLTESVPTVRLRAKQCDKPIYATPLPLRSVAEVELADRTYLNRRGYGSTNVYRGQVRETFSHFARVLARNPLTPHGLDYFVRFYAPMECAIDDQAYVEWAGMILAMGTTSSRSGHDGG